MLVKIFEKMSYKKSGDKFQPNFQKEFLVNLDKVKKIRTKKSSVEPKFYITELFFIDGSSDKIFKCPMIDEISLAQHCDFISSLFLPRTENVQAK